jgi:hypothetical protein
MRISSSTGSHGSTMLPPMRSATISTTNSISIVTNCAATTENTRCSCGNWTFLISPEPPCTLPIDTPTEIEKKLNGSRPHRKNSGKFFMPLGSPVGGTCLNTYRKMIEKISICVSGLSRLHAQPSTDFL